MTKTQTKQSKPNKKRNLQPKSQPEHESKHKPIAPSPNTKNLTLNSKHRSLFHFMLKLLWTDDRKFGGNRVW